MNCLLIDDDLDDHEIFKLALHGAAQPNTCMVARDGREGLDIIRNLGEDVPDYIFIDLNMPRLNGVETLAEIKKMSFKRTPVLIIYSTTSGDQIIKDAISKGADHFLVKPASIKELSKDLNNVFTNFPVNR